MGWWAGRPGPIVDGMGCVVHGLVCNSGNNIEFELHPSTAIPRIMCSLTLKTSASKILKMVWTVVLADMVSTWLV